MFTEPAGMGDSTAVVMRFLNGAGILGPGGFGDGGSVLGGVCAGSNRLLFNVFRLYAG